MRCSQCVGRHLAAAFVVVSLLSASPCGAAERSASKQPADARSGDRAAADLVRQALEAEAAGDTQDRIALLERALKASPDYAAAHWQLGEVRVGNRWLSIDAASQEAARAGNVDQYRQLRATARNTYDDQLRLARFCASSGWKDQERQRLLVALRLRPNAREVIAKLGLVRHRGRLMTRQQAEALKEQSRQTEAANKEWKPQLTRLKAGIESRDKTRRQAALDELWAIRDTAAIPAIESTFAKSSAETGRVIIACLDAMPEQAATDSLVRHAALAEHAEVREAAAQALKARDMFAYMPQLLSGMQAPVEVQFNTFDFEGAIGYRLSLFREGPLFDMSQVYGAVVQPPVVPSTNLQTGGIQARSAQAIARVAGELVAGADLAAAVRRENEASQNLNERVAAVLRATTGEDRETNPKEWWDWWAEFNEIHYPSTKPVYDTVRYTFLGTMPPRSHSCFVPGTLVWTATGTMAIEKIQVGDTVLAQNADTGELAYKAVTATTVGPPLALVSVRAGKETIRSTRGHLFWVDGDGWRMAKHLKAGDILHTARGPLPIESVEEGGEASCHNLVVADYNTYFVTDAQVLVHDINVRGPTTTSVPGLVK